MVTAVEGLLWGLDELPADAGSGHFLVAGASGSGKTVLIERLLWSLFCNPASRLHPFQRAALYDPKQELVSKLHAGLLRSDPRSDPYARLQLLHPFDTRSTSWDMASDIATPIHARQLAQTLVPEHPGRRSSFFDDAVRDLLTGVIQSLIFCAPEAKAWRFRDVLLGVLYEPYLRFLLGRRIDRDGAAFTLGARLSASYLEGDPKMMMSLRASLSARLSVYEPIAAAWEHAERKLSLETWIKSGKDILILGNDEAARVALDAVNQALFKRMTELALSQEDKRRDNPEQQRGQGFTWVFLDEAREAGRLDGLGQLMNKGRSKGVGVVLGFQDIDGLRAVYGTEIAQELTGQCQNIAALQINNPSTARWAAEMFGAFLTEVSERSHSQSLRGEMNVGQQRRALERALVYTGDLMYLPRTTAQQGLTGYFRSPHLDYKEDSLKQHLAWERDIAPYRLPGGSVPDFLPRPVAHHALLPWTKEDFVRLGFVEPVPLYAPTVPFASSQTTSTRAPKSPQPTSETAPEATKEKEASTVKETAASAEAATPAATTVAAGFDATGAEPTESVQDVLARLKARKKRK